MNSEQSLTITPPENDGLTAAWWQREDHIAKWAWAAGFIDGEGCFIVSREIDKRKKGAGGYRSYRASLSITNTHRYSIERLANILEVPARIIIRPKIRRHHKQQWAFQVRKQKTIVRIIKNLLPFLIVKRCVAELLMNFCLLRIGQRGRGRYAQHTSAELFLVQCIKEQNQRKKPNE